MSSSFRSLFCALHGTADSICVSVLRLGGGLEEEPAPDHQARRALTEIEDVEELLDRMPRDKMAVMTHICFSTKQRVSACRPGSRTGQQIAVDEDPDQRHNAELQKEWTQSENKHKYDTCRYPGVLYVFESCCRVEVDCGASWATHGLPLRAWVHRGY